MNDRATALRTVKNVGAAGIVLAFVAFLTPTANAQQPVSPTGAGLEGDYFNFQQAPNEFGYPPTGLGFPGGPFPVITPETHFLQRLDATVDFADFNATPPPGVNSDTSNTNREDWGVVWYGYLTAPATGAYQFGLGTDDGGRVWVNQNPLTTTPDIDNWVLEGLAGNPGNKQSGMINLTMGQVVPIRVEMFQHLGGVGAQLWWKIPGATTYVIVPALSAGSGLSSPVTCGAPTLNAPTTVPGTTEIDLSWTAGTTGEPATGYMIFRGTSANGEGIVPIATVSGTTLTYKDTDPALQYGVQYFYKVQPTAFGGLFIGTSSNEVSCAPNPFGVSPNALMVVEASGTGTITLTTAVAIPNGTTISLPVSVQNTTVPAGPFSFNVSGPSAAAGTSITCTLTGNGQAGQQFQIVVTGVDDQIAADPQTANINMGPTSSATAGWSGLTFPAVQCTQIESDIPGIIVNPTSVSTTNGGPAVNFTVQLATQPQAGTTVVLNLGSTIPYLSVVTGPGNLSTVTFSPANWNTPQQVTVTPNNVDASTLYITSYYVTFTPVQSTDPNYAGIATNSEFVFEPTSTPPLKKVWNCGLLGIEGISGLGLLALCRRRRRARR